MYDVSRGKSKGACSIGCSQKILHYGTKENWIKIHTSNCIVCNKDFIRSHESSGLVCSIKCQGSLSSERMKVSNPMFVAEYRLKASNRQKEIKHKPIIQGGNGRGATIPQLLLYNELIKHDNSFEMEVIERTGHLAKLYKSPRHYKLDIASRIHNLCIEVDGPSHNSLKIKECDKRKTEVLNLKGWRVLRLSNSKIKNELQNCVQMVLSMI
jgi:predicted nucleic acid-binding Zn ribbon protein